MRKIATLAAAATLALSGAAWSQPGPDNHPGPMSPPGPAGAPHPGGPGPHGPGGMPGGMPGGIPGGMGANMAQSMGGDTGRMMDMMRERMGAEAMDRAFQHVDGKLAYIRAELHITDAQQSQWNALADAVRAAMPKLQQAYSQAMPPSAHPVPAPDRIEHRIALLTAQLDAIRSVQGPAKALYAALSDDQKRTADELMADRMLAYPGRGAWGRSMGPGATTW